METFFLFASELLPVVFLVVILGIILLKQFLSAIQIVNQAEQVAIERFGKLHRILKPGLHLIVPFIDYKAKTFNMREKLLIIPEQPVISRDNAPVSVDAIAYYQIIEVSKAGYVVDNLVQALENLVMTNVRTVVGSMDLDSLLSERESINFRLLMNLNEATTPWGIRMMRVEIKDIILPTNLIQSMSTQLTSERDRRSAVLIAEGKKSAVILEAEGMGQAAIIQAEAEQKSILLKAEAEASAAKLISAALENGKIESLQYSIAKQYIVALQELSKSENSKVIMIPLDTTKFLGSIKAIDELMKDKKEETVMPS